MWINAETILRLLEDIKIYCDKVDVTLDIPLYSRVEQAIRELKGEE
jgi:hypothetical protein